MRTDDERDMDRDLEEGWAEDLELDHDPEDKEMEPPCSTTPTK